MTSRLMKFLPEITGSSVSFAGVITAQSAALDYWLRIGSYVVAILAGLFTIASVVKNWGKK